jgi:hypothetical protein
MGQGQLGWIDKKVGPLFVVADSDPRTALANPKIQPRVLEYSGSQGDCGCQAGSFNVD